MLLWMSVIARPGNVRNQGSGLSRCTCMSMSLGSEADLYRVECRLCHTLCELLHIICYVNCVPQSGGIVHEMTSDLFVLNRE